MSNLISNYKAAVNPTVPSATPVVEVKKEMPKTNLAEIKDTFHKEKRKDGLIEKFYNFCKNKTGFGLGSKKVLQEIEKLETQSVKEDEVKNTIKKYKTSEENAAQTFGDVASGLVGVGAYFGLSNLAKRMKARFELGAMNSIMRGVVAKKIEPILKSSATTKAIIFPVTMLAAGLTKYWALKFNRASSDEFKIENKKELDKKELKATKKELRKQRHKLNWKNFYTGALNGLMAPVTALVGGIVGVPAYLIGMSGLRYITSGNEDKSLKDYTQGLTDNAALNTLGAVAVAIPAFKHAKFSKILTENLDSVVKKLKDVNFKNPDLPSNKTAYSEIEEIMLESPSIKKIMDDYGTEVEDKIKALTNENIFAVKFLQIGRNGGAVSEALIENCPPSRTVQEAQVKINALLNSEQFEVSKLLGVGTIAETYLAKDKTGREVCIKILKEGISAEKIEKDKDAFINLITGGAAENTLSKTQAYLIKNINNLAEGISKEVDFENELRAAQKLKKFTKCADVVVPIEAKPGIYIMEKAPGISLDTLSRYYSLENSQKYYTDKLKKPQDEYMTKYYQEELEKVSQQIQKLKERSPDFNEFDLSAGDIKKLLKNYMEVISEQFSKIERNGKTLHADIHPGNIFINLEALKTKKGKLFTLIDTGNTIDLSKTQSMASLKLISFIKNGNVDDITKTLLEGTILPSGLTNEKATELVTKDLKQIFFDTETKINSMNIDETMSLFSNVLRKYDIISNDTQLNLNKAKKSANNSLEHLADSFFNKKYGDLDIEDMSKIEQAKIGAKLTKDAASLGAKFMQIKILQETKNLLKMSPKEIFNSWKNLKMLKTNSEEHLIYKLKQDMPTSSEVINLNLFDA